MAPFGEKMPSGRSGRYDGCGGHGAEPHASHVRTMDPLPGSRVMCVDVFSLAPVRLRWYLRIDCGSG